MDKKDITKTVKALTAAAAAGLILSLTIIGIRDSAQETAPAASMERADEFRDTGLDVPDGDTSFKSYMDYRCITNRESAQYKLQQKCTTDTDGLRRTSGGDYVIAVGSYYSDTVGERFKITTEGGEFYATVGDLKADAHTNRTHQYTAMDGGMKNVIEFVVDVDTLDETAKRMGDISYADGKFEGNVERIEKIE